MKKVLEEALPNMDRIIGTDRINYGGKKDIPIPVIAAAGMIPKDLLDQKKLEYGKHERASLPTAVRKYDETLSTKLRKLREVTNMPEEFLNMFAAIYRRTLIMTEMMRRDAQVFEDDFPASQLGVLLKRHVKALRKYTDAVDDLADTASTSEAIRKDMSEDKIYDLNSMLDYFYGVDDPGLVLEWLSLQREDVSKTTTKFNVPGQGLFVFVANKDGRMNEEEINEFKYTISKQFKVSVKDIKVT